MMESIRLKLNDVSVRFLRMAVEEYLATPADNYTAILEHGVLAGLLKRKITLFMYPKAICALTLRPDEAAVIHRLASHVYSDRCDLSVRNMAYLFMVAIGPRMPAMATDRILQ
jgi:hypothetical protein